MSLRPFQITALNFWHERPDKRVILSHPPGSGKTRTALEVIKDLAKLKRVEISKLSVLVICPARARPTWYAEAFKWVPELQLAPIVFGRGRAGLSKAQRAQRDISYASPARIVSYGLLREITQEPTKYDIIIPDESHKLSNPQSEQSRDVADLFRLNPQAAIVETTGTFIRKEVSDCWNQLQLPWPGRFGKPTLGGDVSFAFRQKYCQERDNPYTPSGKEYYGANPKTLASLRAALAPYVHFVSDEEVAPFLPKMDVQPLYIDDKSTYSQAVVSWTKDAVDNYSHVGIICYHPDTAKELEASLKRLGRPIYVATGKQTVEKRSDLLQAARSAQEAIFIGTSEAVGESVSLTFCRKVLVTQWRTTPGQAVQLLRRFRRAEEDAKPVVIDYLIFPEDTAKSKLLLSRAKAVVQLEGEGQTTGAIAEIMGPRELTEDRLEQLFDQMFSEIRTVTEGEESDE